MTETNLELVEKIKIKYNNNLNVIYAMLMYSSIL